MYLKCKHRLSSRKHFKGSKKNNFDFIFYLARFTEFHYKAGKGTLWIATGIVGNGVGTGFENYDLLLFLNNLRQNILIQKNWYLKVICQKSLSLIIVFSTMDSNFLFQKKPRCALGVLK